MEEQQPELPPETPPSKSSSRLRRWLVSFAVVFALALLSIYGAYRTALQGLPKLDKATDYRPFLPTVIFDIHGKVAAEYGEQRRIVVPYDQIPQHVINAFLAAEDASFFSHGGVNIIAIARAAVKNFTSGKVRQGASTITQQVAKTFFLSPERTIIRKLREIALAYKLEQELSKEEILYLYLNQIYFGAGAYGIESAANIYFAKGITEVTVAEAAVLAGLPKAPSAYSPYDNPERARQRQLYVIGQMVENKFLTAAEGELVRNERVAIRRWQNPAVIGGYYTEQVRRYLFDTYGEERVLRDGLRVEAGLDVNLQRMAQEAVRRGVIDLEKRHGYRGPISQVAENDREKTIAKLERELHAIAPGGVLQVLGPAVTEATGEVHAAELPNEPVKALVRKVTREQAILAVGEHEAVLPLFDNTWAVRFDLDNLVARTGGLVNLRQALKAGDLILVEVVDAERVARTDKVRYEKWTKLKVNDGIWWANLLPTPEVQAALLSTDSDTSEVRAMVGGFDFFASQFNRTMQARRQPGSSFKPVVYAAAITMGYNPATMVVDSPDVYVNMAEDSTEVTYWKPKNYDDTFFGPITLREALMRSRNVPTLRIAQDVGIERIIQMARKLGINSPIPRDFSIALGSSGASLFELSQAYTTINAGGVRRELKFVRRVLDRDGNVLEQQVPDWVIEGRTPSVKERAEGDVAFYKAEVALSPEHNYQMIYLLSQVVQHGTAWRTRVELQGRPAGGKTGTTNDNVDSWFMGFTPEYVTGVWVGFDQPERNLGPSETGSMAANPIWNDFMKQALKDKPIKDWPVPGKIVFRNIDTKTGYQAGPASEKVAKMPFIYGTEPTVATSVETPLYEDELLKMDMSF
jgi:penicillin-binding protein 1A